MTRLLQYALVFGVAVSLNFFLPRLMPGDPLALLAGADVTSLSADARATLRAEAGLDRPLLVQYGRYLRQLATGDLGYSCRRAGAVTTVLGERLPWTILLLLTSQAIALVLGVLLALLVVAARRTRVDAAVLGGIVALDALPVFWIGMVLVALFAVRWPLFPVFGAESVWAAHHGLARLSDIAHHLVLPLVTLVAGSLSGPFLVARAVLESAMAEPFVTAARARGLGATAVIVRHAFRVAMPPLVAAAATTIGVGIGGATLVETVFAYPGLGRLAYEAVLSRDYPVLQGTFLVVTLGVLVAGAAADQAVTRLDPRTRPPTRRGPR